MKKNSLFLMLLLLSAGVWAGPTPITPPNGVAFELIVRQKPATIEKYFEITRDTIKVLMGKPLSAFLVNFSLRVELKEADSQSVEFTTHLVTVGSTPFTAGERFRSEYNLPARIENIPGKDSSVYQLLISPRSLVIIDTSRCAYDPDVAGQYEYDPSANFDIYYVKGSLADFDWNNIKNYLETDYAYFRNALDITAPGKTSYYLCPCLSPSINWDKRFGYAIDPGRANVYSIYSQDFVSTDAMLPNMLKLLRLWGYAPPFLVEGLAGYFDFVTYEMKKIRKQEGFPEIKKLLTTSGYYSASPHTAEVTAASFIKFLADSYGIDKVKQLYEKSDDLTLMMNFGNVYSLPIDSLEILWQNYLDTISLKRSLFDLYAARAGALFQSNKQIEYYEEMTKYDQTRVDSAATWEKLALAYYQYGHYYKAEEGYKRLIVMDSTRAQYYQIMGNLMLMDARYDMAWGKLDAVVSIDSTYATARLLQAKILAIKADTSQAIKLAEKFYPVEKSTPGKIEFQLFMGKMYGAKGSNFDSTAANKYFTNALAWSSDMAAKAPEDPTYKLRMGLAYLGLEDFENAEKYLKLALFFERRPFHQGEALIGLGNLYDLSQNHKKAIEFYQRALTLPLAAYQRDLCIKYIDQPYRK